MEALVIVFVFVVAVGVYLGMRFGGGAHLARTPAEQREQLQAYRASLEEKIRRGRAERWDAVMMGQLADKLADVDRQIAEKPGRR